MKGGRTQEYRVAFSRMFDKMVAKIGTRGVGKLHGDEQKSIANAFTFLV